MPTFRLPIFEEQRRAAGAGLRDAKVPARVREIVDAAHGLAASALEELEQRSPPTPAVACRAGCAWCCHTRVVVTEAEVVRIAEYLRARQAPEALEATRARVRMAASTTRAMTADERYVARVACPLLEDERCSVHEVRPLACLGYNSADASACERAWRDGTPRDVIAGYSPQLEVAGAIHVGLVQGVRDAGLRGSALELNAALHIALERAGVAERWLEGRHPFAPAVDAQGSTSLDAVLGRLARRP